MEKASKKGIALGTMEKTIFYNSKGVAFLLAGSIAAVTTGFLSMAEVSLEALLINFLLTLFSSFILINVVLEFLIFKEVSKIYAVLKKIKKKDLSTIASPKKSFFNPIKDLNQEIFIYATLKQREIDDLKKMATFRREFLANVSHELKTPIFAAQGYVHTLLDGAMEDETVREKFLRKAAKSLDGLDMLVQDLLALSQLETGEITMHSKIFNIANLTQEVFDQIEVKAAKRNIKLQFAEDLGNKVLVYADPQRIEQVMTNLISNAIKYSEDNGTVTVSFKTKKNEVTILVSDNGQGIPPEHQNRIFERFYRVEKSRSKDKGGTGLGLAIVKHIIEAHQSTVSVKSKAGEGATFQFKLPKRKKRLKKTQSANPKIEKPEI